MRLYPLTYHSPLATKQLTLHLRLPPCRKYLHPEPLYIDFTPILDGVENAGSVSYSVAKLDLVGKKIPKGIQISPELVGQWSWNSESQLKFMPKQDWSAGQEYEVSFSESIFKADIKLSDNEHVFKTPDFELSLSTLAFYQDPNVKNSHKVVATLIATHPTDIDSVKSHLKLTQSFTKNNKSEVKPYKFDVTYDKHQREIYITSEPIQIQDTESYMYFTLDSGVKPVVGSSKADTGIKESVLIPSVNSFFRINTADVLMVKNAAGEPEQTFVLEFTDEIASQDVINKTTAYILPNIRFKRCG